jgi:hypothetical protein
MRSPLLLLLPTALLIACGETAPLAPADNSDLAKGGGGRPAASNITAVSLGFTQANDIDEYGRVVGWNQSRAPTQAFLWTPATRRATTGSGGVLPGVTGSNTYATGINEAQQIAGVFTGATAEHAVFWNATALNQLGDGGGSGGAADDISDPLTSGGDRLVVGHGDGPFQAAVWRVTSAGGFSGPVTLPGAEAGGQAIGVNSSGTIVGDLESPTSLLPQRWTPSTTGTGWVQSTLDLLPGSTSGQALGVNADGAAVGFNTAASGCNHGVAWAQSSSTAIPLQDLTGGSCSFAWSINRAGQITGSARDARGRQQAVLWTPLESGGGYSILALTGAKSAATGEGHGLNEPEMDGSGNRSVEVVGTSGGRATLWKVKLP